MILSPNKYKDLPVANRQGSAAQQTALTPRKTENVAAQAGRWLLASLVAMAILFGSSAARAQQITGAITGKVVDEQGALVTNANIKATNVATGYTRSTKTDDAGGYNIQYLPIGGYTVTVDAPGFKKFVQQNLEIAVDQTQPLNVTLSVGAESQTIEVTTAPPVINTATSEVGRTISPHEMNNFPLTTRNAYAALSAVPGVQSNSQSNSQNTPNFVIGVPSTQVIINGGVDGGVPMVSFYLDGGINMTGLRNYGNPLPNPDALEEFRVETSNYGAQYGRMSGGVVSAVTRSGTNKFHGSLFEFFRDTNMNANSWGALPTAKTPFHRNNFGGTVGGPIVKDKAFFFFSYGGLRQTVGQFLSGGIVPTALERQGDFTQSYTYAPATGVKTPIIPNMPGTKTPWVGTNSSVNCTVAKQGCIPQTGLDVTAANLLKSYIPLPNAPTVAAPGNYVGNFTSPTNQNEYLGKYDQVLGAKDHISVSYFYLRTTQGGYGGGNIPYSINNSFATQQNANISDIHTFGATTANQVWLNFTRVAGGRENTPAVSLGDLGSSFTIQGPKGLPQLAPSGYFSAGGALAGPVSDTNFYGLRDVVSLTKGRHTLNLGAEVSLEKDEIVGNLYNFGVINFNSSGPTTTGNVAADFVTGQVSSMEQDNPYHGLLNTWYYAFFAQDNYRITPRFTANLGLRYDIEQAPVESQNLTAAFVPGRQSTVVPSAPLGVLFPGDSGIPRGIAQTPKTHFSPRIGMAWDPFGDGKTAIRGAAGIFYGSVSGNEWNQPANAQPYAIRQTFNSITSLSNVYGNKASFPTGDPFPYVYSPNSPRWLPSAAVEAIDPNYKWPASYQFNVAVEQQLPAKIVLQTAYVGNLVRHVPTAPDANNPIFAPGAGTGQASLNARRPYFGATNANGNTLGQVILIESGQTANFHSLQVSVHRPLGNNFLINGFLVWSHSIWSSNASAIGLAPTAQNYSYLNEERGPSDQDRRNMVGINGVWNVNYYNGSSRFLGVLLNGYSISTIASFNSGQPVNITTGSDNNKDNYNNDRPNLVPGVNPFLSHSRPRFTASQAWFNTAAFSPNCLQASTGTMACTTTAGIGPGGADGNTPRDFLRAPGYRDVDLGISRQFKFERGIGLTFRADATNAFNLVSLNAPTATLSSGNDGKITGAASPRLIQVGARITF
jgi:Carboxypeptidase regulatory-like domain/TonB dependent receptor